jgi:hypothetical protein
MDLSGDRQQLLDNLHVIFFSYNMHAISNVHLRSQLRCGTFGDVQKSDEFFY